MTGWVLKDMTEPIGGQPLLLRPYICRNPLIYRVLRAAVKWRDGVRVRENAKHLSLDATEKRIKPIKGEARDEPANEADLEPLEITPA